MPKLMLKDGEMEVDLKILKASALINGMIEEDDDKENTSVPLPVVDVATMTLIVEYLTEHTDKPFPTIEKPLKSEKLDVILEAYKWELDWLKRLSPVNEDLSALIACQGVYDTVLASNYLDIGPLVQILTMVIATWLKARTPTQLRKALGQNENPTPEFEAAIREANQWVFAEVDKEQEVAPAAQATAGA